MKLDRNVNSCRHPQMCPYGRYFTVVKELRHFGVYFREPFETAAAYSVFFMLHDWLENVQRQVLNFTIAFQEIILSKSINNFKPFLKILALVH